MGRRRFQIRAEAALRALSATPWHRQCARPTIKAGNGKSRPFQRPSRRSRPTGRRAGHAVDGFRFVFAQVAVMPITSQPWSWYIVVEIKELGHAADAGSTPIAPDQHDDLALQIGSLTGLLFFQATTSGISGAGLPQGVPTGSAASNRLDALLALSGARQSAGASCALRSVDLKCYSPGGSGSRNRGFAKRTFGGAAAVAELTRTTIAVVERHAEEAPGKHLGDDLALRQSVSRVGSSSCLRSTTGDGCDLATLVPGNQAYKYNIFGVTEQRATPSGARPNVIHIKPFRSPFWLRDHERDGRRRQIPHQSALRPACRRHRQVERRSSRAARPRHLPRLNMGAASQAATRTGGTNRT